MNSLTSRSNATGWAPIIIRKVLWAMTSAAPMSPTYAWRTAARHCLRSFSSSLMLCAPMGWTPLTRRTRLPWALSREDAEISINQPCGPLRMQGNCDGRSVHSLLRQNEMQKAYEPLKWWELSIFAFHSHWKKKFNWYHFWEVLYQNKHVSFHLHNRCSTKMLLLNWFYWSLAAPINWMLLLVVVWWCF